jgi:hypothetical protein
VLGKGSLGAPFSRDHLLKPIFHALNLLKSGVKVSGEAHIFLL